MAIYSGGMAASASWLANMSQNVRGGESHAAPIDYAPEAYFAEPANASSGNESEPVAQVRTPCFRAGREQAKHGLSGVGAGMMGAGAAVMNRFGSVARFIGHAVVEGSGDGSGLEYRAITAFCTKIGATTWPIRTHNNTGTATTIAIMRVAKFWFCGAGRLLKIPTVTLFTRLQPTGQMSTPMNVRKKPIALLLSDR